MSNQLISGEYLYKGRINYFLVKCHIYQGNKQIYNYFKRSHYNYIKGVFKILFQKFHFILFKKLLLILIIQH